MMIFKPQKLHPISYFTGLINVIKQNILSLSCLLDLIYGILILQISDIILDQVSFIDYSFL